MGEGEGRKAKFRQTIHIHRVNPSKQNTYTHTHLNNTRIFNSILNSIFLVLFSVFSKVSQE